MQSIFISYKRHREGTETVVRALEQALGAEFTLRRDQRIEAGQRWTREIYDWLLSCDVGIVIVEPEAVTSDWCRREWSVLAARQQTTGLTVIPIHLGDHIHDTGIFDDLQGILWSEQTLAHVRALLASVRRRLSPGEDFLAAHHAWLRWQFGEERLFGQEPFALKDVYIDTECGQLCWRDINDGSGKSPVDAFLEESGGRHQLLDAVFRKLGDPNFRDMLVVQAGPGSGKSAFTLKLANALLDRGMWPILVRFRDLRLATYPDVGELIDDAIRIAPADEDSPNASGMVSHVMGLTHALDQATLCRGVFILDGWDEVSLTANVTYQAQLREWLPKLRQFFIDARGAPIRVVLTGRPSAELGQSGVLRKETPVLTVRPIQPAQLRAYARSMKRHFDAERAAGRELSWSVDETRLEPIFQNYDQWFGAYKSGRTPDTSLSDVLGNPLLAYLTFRVLATSKKEPQQIVAEPTALYHELINATVAHAGKGHDARLEAAVHRGGERLRLLLHEVASTISIFRGESVSYTEVKLRFADEELPLPHDLLNNWKETHDAENALRELVVNFYFKGGNTALGYEFLHKSFREYLFAEAVVQALDDSAERGKLEPFNSANDAHARDFPRDTTQFRLARRLSYLLAPQWLTPEVFGHISWLLRQRTRSDPERWLKIRELATDVYAWWAEGVHLRHQPTGSRHKGRWAEPFIDQLLRQAARFDDPEETFIAVRSTALDAHLGFALLSIVCVLHQLIELRGESHTGRRARYQRLVTNTVRFRPGGGGFFHALLSRLVAEGWRSSPLHHMSLGPVDLSDEFLGGASLRFVDLSGADLSHCRLTGAALQGANLTGANLERAILVRADLSDAKLRDANLSRASLQFADMIDAQLTGARLCGADMRRAVLLRGSLENADLGGARLDSCDLSRATLTGALIERNALDEALNVVECVGVPTFVEPPKKAPT